MIVNSGSGRQIGHHAFHWWKYGKAESVSGLVARTRCAGWVVGYFGGTRAEARDYMLAETFEPKCSRGLQSAFNEMANFKMTHSCSGLGLFCLRFPVRFFDNASLTGEPPSISRSRCVFPLSETETDSTDPHQPQQSQAGRLRSA